MDVMYEESAVDQNAARNSKKYAILHVLSMIAILLAGFFLVLGIFMIPGQAKDDAVHAEVQTVCFLLFLQAAVFAGLWFFLTKWKSRMNASYDYLFVTGELRISKVIGNRRRKLIAIIDCEDMQQIGDVDSDTFESLHRDPSTTMIVCTTNHIAAEGKFFMYVLAAHEGKKLFILECREELLTHILQFTRRGVLDKQYVAQEKKQR